MKLVQRLEAAAAAEQVAGAPGVDRVAPMAVLLEIFGVAQLEGICPELPPDVANGKDALCSCFDRLCAWHRPRASDFAPLLEVSEILPSIFLVHAASRVTLASTFLRLQEYYESPAKQFRHSFFTLEEYQEWYRETKQDGDCGGFDYYLKWPGFNVPSWVVDAFRHGAGGPLRAQEEALLSCLPPLEGARYYVIGSCEKDLPTLHHEMAHGLYATNTAYNAEVRTCMAKLAVPCVETMRAKLLDLGYVDDADIIADEMHAYMVDGSGLGGGPGAADVQSELQGNFSKVLWQYYIQRLTIRFIIR